MTFNLFIGDIEYYNAALEYRVIFPEGISEYITKTTLMVSKSPKCS